jgi:hypothetical protein
LFKKYLNAKIARIIEQGNGNYKVYFGLGKYKLIVTYNIKSNKLLQLNLFVPTKKEELTL